MAIHSDTVALLAFLDERRAALRLAVDSVPESSRSRRPSPDRWSVAEVLEHLATIETLNHKLLRHGLEVARAEGRARPAHAALFVIDERLVERTTDRRERWISPEFGEPRGGTVAEASWKTLETVRAEIRQVVAESDAFAFEAPLARHPFLGPLTYREWIVFLGAHEARHAAQIVEVSEALATGEQAGPPR
jgi:hypothetical protein